MKARTKTMDNRYLFRGKCETTGKWFYGSLSQTQSWDYKKEKALVHCIVHETDRGLLIKEIDPATVGQCTGLSAKKSYRGDKHEDLLIWEGDVLKAIIGDTEFIFPAYREDGEWFGAADQMRAAVRSGAEIIGTIYDKEANTNV